MKRWVPNPLLTLVLTLLWLLLNNTASFGHLLLGLALAVVIVRLCQPFLMTVPKLARPGRLALFALRVFGDIVVANLHVAKLVLGPGSRLAPAFIEVPMRIDDEFVLTLLTSIVSLTPGTVSAALSADRRTLLIHALDAPDPVAVAEEIRQRYEAPLMEIFQCSRS